MTQPAVSYCSYCREEIKAGATKCKHCHSIIGEPETVGSAVLARAATGGFGSINIFIGGGGLFDGGGGDHCDIEYDKDIAACQRAFDERHKDTELKDKPLFDDALLSCKQNARNKRKQCRKPFPV